MGMLRDTVDWLRYGVGGRPEAKAVWTLDGGRPGASDGDNFRTNKITVAEAMDHGAAGGAAAIGYSATWACVNLIAGTAASLSVSVLRKDPNGVKREVSDHPLYWILRMDPNFDMDDYQFWEFIFASIELHGNAYAQTVRGVGGNIVALMPLRPEAVSVRRLASGDIEYSWSSDGKPMKVSQTDMLHVRGFGGGPLGGLSTLRACSRTFGGALAVDSTAKALFDNGVRPSGVLSAPEGVRLTPDQRKEAERKLQERFVGAMNQGRPMLLDGGLKWESLAIDPADAQMLESRKFSGEEVCRLKQQH